MILHIRLENYNCSNCEMVYIPFSDQYPCPRCDFIDKEVVKYHNFAEEIVRSMMIHKKQYGSYQPPAWYSGVPSEILQSLCFKFFDQLELGGLPDFDEALGLVTRPDEFEQKYLKDLLSEIYIRLKI